MKKKPEKINKFDRPPLKLFAPPIRPGSMTILQSPSRIAKTLFYPDGTTKHENDTSKKSNADSGKQ